MSLKKTKKWLSIFGYEYDLKELKNITRLVLSNNKIQDLSPLKELKNLTSKELKNLVHLDLSKNPIILIEGQDSSFLDSNNIEYKTVPDNPINRELYL